MAFEEEFGGEISDEDAQKITTIGEAVNQSLNLDTVLNTAIDKMTKETLGSTLAAPFMTLSFMALLVIPHLKLSDLGLFDADAFSFVDPI